MKLAQILVLLMFCRAVFTDVQVTFFKESPESLFTFIESNTVLCAVMLINLHWKCSNSYINISHFSN